MAIYSLDLELSSGQFASIADASQTGLDLAGDLTYECWLKLEQKASTAGTQMTLASKFGTNGNNRAYAVTIRPTNDKVALTVSDDGTATDGHQLLFESATALGDSYVGVWVHIAVSFDISEETCKFYIDTVEESGTLAGGTTMGASLYNSSRPFAIGCLYGAADAAVQFLDGKTMENRLWSDIRTPTEIADNYNTQLLGTETGLVGYWRFNNSYTDETSNNNDLTDTGSPVFALDSPVINASIAPDALTTTSSLPEESVVGNASIAPDPLVVTSSLPAAIAGVFITITPDPLTLTSSLPEEAVTGSALVSPDALVGTFSEPSATITGNANVSPGLLNAIFSFQEPVRTGGLWEGRSKPTATWTERTKPIN